MSGSNSSARDSGARSEAAASPLSFTVHSVPPPGLVARRTAVGRLKMLVVLLVCASPVIASYFTYFVIRPDGRSNYSTLITPTRELPEALRLQSLDGSPVTARSLHGQWLLVSVGPAACNTTCEQNLVLQRQLRETLGREKDRLDKVWLLTDGAQPTAQLRQALGGPAPTTVLRADPQALAAWLQPELGRALEDHLYLVDPMGQWMMRVPAQPDPAKLKRDVERLLRASSSWDQPGRS